MSDRPVASAAAQELPKIKFSKTLLTLPESVIPKFSRMVTEAEKDNGVSRIFVVGNPTHPLSDSAKEIMSGAISTGNMAYGTSVGDLALRDAIAKQATEFYQSKFTDSNVVITSGSKEAVSLAYTAVSNGDDSLALVLTPSFPAYMPAIHIAGSKAIFAESTKESGFKPNIAIIKQRFLENSETDKATGKTGTKIRSVTINYPNNPTGAVLTEDDARELAGCFNEMYEKYFGEDGFVLILDDVYKDIGGKSCSIFPHLSELARQNTVIIDSASKTSAMAGGRVGCAICANQQITNMILSVHGATIESVNTVMQKGWRADIITNTAERLGGIRKYYKDKCDFVQEEIGKVCDGVKLTGRGMLSVENPGSIFLFLDLSAMIGKEVPEAMRETIGKDVIENDADIFRYLLNAFMLHNDDGSKLRDEDGNEVVGVGTIPGSGFFIDSEKGFVRLSIAGSFNKSIEEDVELKKATKSLVSAISFLVKEKCLSRPSSSVSSADEDEISPKKTTNSTTFIGKI
jgi:aspartate/methionine/tyrosine aminotransferase